MAETSSGLVGGRYRILGQLGKGAMGLVFMAHDPVLDRKVAIKQMTAEIADNEELRQRFYVEARAAARLNHPNIITIHELQESGGEIFMIMELLEGKSLASLIEARPVPLSLEATLDVMSQVCDGLDYAHQRAIVHRDIKPANLFLTPSGTVKVLDFGIARLGSLHMTATGALIGTPDYMAPEQIRGDEIDRRTDLWAVGAVLYQLLSGTKPFEGTPLARLLSAISKLPHTPLLQRAPAVPKGVSDLVDRLLSKPREGRPATAGLVRDELRAILGRESSAATRATLAEADYEETLFMATASRPPAPAADATAPAPVPPRQTPPRPAPTVEAAVKTLPAVPQPVEMLPPSGRMAVTAVGEPLPDVDRTTPMPPAASAPPPVAPAVAPSPVVTATTPLVVAPASAPPQPASAIAPPALAPPTPPPPIVPVPPKLPPAPAPPVAAAAGRAAVAGVPAATASRWKVLAAVVVVGSALGIAAFGGAAWWHFRSQGSGTGSPTPSSPTTTSSTPSVTPSSLAASQPPAAVPDAAAAATPPETTPLEPPPPGGAQQAGPVTPPVPPATPPAQPVAPQVPPAGPPPAQPVAAPAVAPSAAAPAGSTRQAPPVVQTPQSAAAPAARPPVESGVVAAPAGARPGVSQDTVETLSGRQPGQAYDAATAAASTTAAVTRINLVLGEYVKALVNADANAIRDYRSTLSPEESALMRARQLKVRLEDVRIEVNGAEATARCRRKVEGISSTGAPLQEDAAAVYRLVRKPSGWMITEVR